MKWDAHVYVDPCSKSRFMNFSSGRMEQISVENVKPLKKKTKNNKIATVARAS